MVYYKLILDTRRKRTDSIYPVVIRITFNRTHSTISTGVRLKEQHWDSASQLVSKNNQNFQSINKSISDKYLKVQKAILKLQESNEFSFEKLRIELSDKPIVKVEQISFYEFSNKLIVDMMKLNQTGNGLIYQTALNRFIAYSNKSLKFQEIDYNLLNGFKNSLILSGVKQNTISNYFRTLKAIYNKAIKAKVVDRSLYPFYDISIRQEKTINRAVSVKQIKNIVSHELKINSSEWHARNYFMLSFLLIGVSFTDLAYLKPENIVKGRIIFSRRKTHKRYSIKLLEETKKILSYCTTSDSKYLLPIIICNVQEDSIQAKKLISQWIKTTNKYLKRIGTEIGLESPLTTYVARHTWATTAKRLGYSNELIAEAMGHEYGNRTTAIYLDSFDQDVIDEMNKEISKNIIHNKL
ncbi:MAG: hypothetical protein B7X86_14385 [Sphingobacteriales bacterium 17-39-43]|uniref:site-specific integrase n=1 Tax=Daejeonella sp. TaxID=2805397 RepID=UPI000BD1F255|nr:site-specific integrase [Daejeonella sp.]OYZ30135.1 MAG: hypothetical protein B7Y24_14150 [Sphingobacteriales bacterium 16-39-50]OZA22853.1 MAG: hypothetical protein B7X86_14385 [Sphingobacteriales bacterium 17-39-43]HQT23995.1 site-specific integrase [Daejeonella sp.]HQT58659.1 site-specific integrase [Daejeonella sp.]